jgi:hypothetical protein
MLKNRKSLSFLLIPYIVYLGFLPFANRVYPRVFGLSFLTFWMFVGVVITPLSIWLASLWDPVHQQNKNKVVK